MNRINVNISKEIVSIPNDLKSIIKKLLAKKNYYNSGIIDEIDNGTLELSDYHKLLVDLINNFRIIVEMYEGSKCLPTLEKDMYDKVEKICEKYYSFFKYEYDDYCCRYYDDNKEIISKLNEIVRDYYTALKLQDEMYIFRELKDYYSECISNMEFFMSEEQIDEFKSEYNDALSKRDTETMMRLIKNVQKLILDDWYKSFDNMDNMTDDNFCFIGHSVRNNSIEGDFRSKFVSCSLFNKDLTDTYNCPYGFIMGPENIIAADSKDMYVNNDARDSESLTNTHYLPKISHLKRIIKECVDLKKKNSDNGKTKDYKVYSEIVLNKFEPKGIFCFVDGEKEIDYFYNQALNLQKSFPNLKIYTFNRLNTKNEFDNTKYKINFLYNLEKYTGNKIYNNDEKNIYRYDMFFKEYAEILKNKNHTLDDVVAALNRNLQLLEYYDKKTDDLFNGTYNDEEIEYILGNNINYGIKEILKGNITTPYTINKLVGLLPYSDRLNKYYDGLEELVIMLSKVTITDSMIEDLQNIDNISLISIAKYLTTVLTEKLTEQKETVNNKNDRFKEEYDELIKERDSRKKERDKYDYYRSILEKDGMLALIKADIRDIEIHNSEIDINISRLENSLLVLKSQYDELCKKRDNNEDSTLIVLNEKRNKLLKHPIIYRRKLKKLNNKYELCKSLVEEDIKSQLRQIEIRLEIVKDELTIQIMSRQNNSLSMNNIDKKINDYFGCKTVKEVEDLLLEARLFVDRYNFNNDYYLENVCARLEEIENFINRNNQALNTIESDEQLVETIKSR